MLIGAVRQMSEILTVYFQSASRHNVRATLVPDLVRSQPEQVHRRGAAVRLLLVCAAAVSCLRDCRHRLVQS